MWMRLVLRNPHQAVWACLDEPFQIHQDCEKIYIFGNSPLLWQWLARPVAQLFDTMGPLQYHFEWRRYNKLLAGETAAALHTSFLDATGERYIDEGGDERYLDEDKLLVPVEFYHKAANAKPPGKSVCDIAQSLQISIKRFQEDAGGIGRVSDEMERCRLRVETMEKSVKRTMAAAAATSKDPQKTEEWGDAVRAADGGTYVGAVLQTMDIRWGRWRFERRSGEADSIAAPVKTNSRRRGEWRARVC